MSIESNIKCARETPVDELIAIAVGLLTAIEEAHAMYGGNLDVCPLPLQRFCRTLEAVSTECLGR